ncbi:Hypothetical protein I595_2602 [Croceitalea dokdonensis DOKDO 023]|uniref:SPOR domain-containing protein n=1 Tax=Croceitalea dokdonensis DOKDO 023 TaxID=1300341 RepID=A0A0P7AY97_9FLAO|nr:SPOR domain-containing protein [Croceitalea dokdonensis]KPM31335.1 Hypothetical protein I595_2602 [Croceitalea dokdonensis DOKDO 023]
MKPLVLLAVFLLTAFNALGQEGTVTIEQEPKINEVIKLYKKVNEKRTYYQIQVGFGGASKAERLKSEVETDFPGLYTKIEFQEPTYRVRLGKFYDRLEADRKFIEVRKKYPEAMLLTIDKDED